MEPRKNSKSTIVPLISLSKNENINGQAHIFRVTLNRAKLVLAIKSYWIETEHLVIKYKQMSWSFLLREHQTMIWFSIWWNSYPCIHDFEINGHASRWWLKLTQRFCFAIQSYILIRLNSLLINIRLQLVFPLFAGCETQKIQS